MENDLQFMESVAYSLFKKLPLAICILSTKNLIIAFANENYYQLFGKEPSCIGNRLYESLPELESTNFETHIKSVLALGEPMQLDELPLFFFKNGKKHHYSFSCTFNSLKSKENENNDIVVIFTDVTAQVKSKRLASKNHSRLTGELDILKKEYITATKKPKLQNKVTENPSKNNLNIASPYTSSLIEAIQDPLFTIGTSGKIIEVNQATERVTGIPREKLTSTYFYNYFTEPQKAKKVFVELFKTGFVIDFPLTLKDHTLIEVLLNGSTYKDNNNQVAGAVMVARDITKQKKIERELIDAIVFAENAQKTAENAQRIAENAVNAKQQFLSNMSHEIRTPMNTIIGFTKVMLKTDLSDKQKEYINAIKMSGDALIVLINDILDLAKVNAGKMTFEKTPFKLNTSISAMIHLFENKIQEKNLTLTKIYDRLIPEMLLGDPMRLHQIILNLLSNAVKFTAKGQITVGVKLVHEDQEMVIIEFAVSDTGIGIESEKLATVFDNFEQANTTTSRTYGGTGLGLAIVKQLVELQHGTVYLKSELHVGSTFSFTLPFKKTRDNAKQSEHLEVEIKKKNISVLVVEDIALNQLLMKTVLDDFGFEQDIACNGKIAIEKLRIKEYDIVLMDLQMPEMNGFEATEYIRKNMKLTLPIIALTADVTSVNLSKCVALGMNDYVSKPIDEKLLYDKIMNLVKKKVKSNNKDNENTAPKLMQKTMQKTMHYTNLKYLYTRTKSDSKLMMEMIQLYLKQTPVILHDMKKCLNANNWIGLHSAAHKLLPSFSIVGIDQKYEIFTKKIIEYAQTYTIDKEIYDLVKQIELACLQACKELLIEFNLLNKQTQTLK
jgi:PAS domain S-box-containing protein